MRGTWEEMGKPDAHARALAEAKRILTHDNPSVFSSEVDAKIRERFKDLVEGNARWYD
jgi:trimethylamine--corrinoid protein Co-methyltransferase